MTARICDICHEAESKYKCAQCELRYCSLRCFKTHKISHDSDAAVKGDPAIKSEDSLAKQQPGQAAPKQAIDPYMALQTHPRFQPLFTKYPNLKSQLQRVWQASQNPYGNRDEPRPRIRDRVQGQWTQDKADELATKVLADLRKQDDGVQEFMALLSEVSNP